MSARRQSSTTSLAKYARMTSPDPNIMDSRSFDFCNAFWGDDDSGVDVLFTRMRGAARTTEELRNFWKERSTIEEEYAKRLAKLAKMPIGKDEIGELRNSIDTLRLETDKQAGFHSQLAQQIRLEMEAPVGTFAARQQQHKKVYQAAIEKEFKGKQTKEQQAAKAREKYESDCVRINSYTAQSSLVQGKDLERINMKLGRAQQTVQVNESDYIQSTKTLQETMQKWEQDWKAFCDTCQDLEEERMEFLKDHMWAYANAVSLTCVADDESCERLRVALEQLEPEKDMENFVRDYGTGNAIPDPPAFVDYANTDTPPTSGRAATRPATFIRNSQKANRVAALSDEELDDEANHIIVGAGPSHSIPLDAGPLSRSGTQRSTTSPRAAANGINGHVSPTREPPQRRQSTVPGPAMPISGGDPVDPTVTSTQLVIGDRAWDVDPNKDPQQQKTIPARMSPPVGEQDPLVKQMAELSTAITAGGSVRRNTVHREGPPSSIESRKGTNDSLSTLSTTTSAGGLPRDLRSPGEVAGSYPTAQVWSRPASPVPPKTVLTPPPPPSTSSMQVEQVTSDYQRFPGEPRIRSVSPTRASSPGATHMTDERPTSRGDYASITASRMVPRPQSPGGISSPAPPVESYNRGPPAPTSAAGNSMLQRGMSVSRPQVTPTNPVGIALGPDGRVVQDMMAQQQSTRQASYPPPGPPPAQPVQSHPPYPTYQDSSRVLTQQPPPLRTDYGVVAPNAYGSGQAYNYGHAPQRSYNEGHPVESYGQPAQSNYNNYGQVARSPYHQPNQSVGQVGAGNAHQRYTSNTSVYRPASPAMIQPPSPAPPQKQAPAPTGAYTDDGRPILFYVKALYDYTATIDEEFDFQTGDIIAVTETPEDGWWSGELLDDSRRQPGRHVFPSNFVCLF